MKLEKSRTVARTKANAGLYIAGIGKVRTEIHIETPKSTSRIKGNNIKFIVKAVDNLSLKVGFGIDFWNWKRTDENNPFGLYAAAD